MASSSERTEFASNLRLVIAVLSKILLFDILISLLLFLSFGLPDYSHFLSPRNINDFFFTTGVILALSGFIVLILFSFTSQRTTSTAVMTSQWGKSSKGPSNYSNEIISRQMKDWPTLMAGIISLFLVFLMMGFVRA